MKDITPVVRASKRIEALLEEKFGAQGRGLHEKFTSVEHHVPAELHKTIRYIATVRNKAVHEDNYELDDEQGFLRQAERVAQALEALKANPNAAAATPARTSRGGRKSSRISKLLLTGAALAIGLLMACGFLGAIFGAGGKERTRTASTGSTAPRTQKTQPPDTQGSKKEELAQATAAMFSTGSKQSKPAGQSAAKEPAAKKPAAPAHSEEVLQRFAQGEHVSLDSPQLKVEKISMAIGKGSFNRLKPNIQLTVKNTSGKTLSSATYDVRLFIDSQPEAVLEERAGGLRGGGLLVSFGEQGLKADASVTVRAILLEDDGWEVPDILNAKRWQLVIRNSRVSDGLKKYTDVESPSFAGLPTTTPLYTAPAPSAVPAKAVDTVDFAAALRDRVSAGAGNQALAVQSVQMKLGRGSFGRTTPIITVEVTNIGERTLSLVVFQAQLYLEGQDKPVLKTGEKMVGAFSDAPDALFASFGERGLAPGQKRTVELRPSGMGNDIWTTPDVLNAKSHLVLLRVVETSDGLKKPYGGAAQRLP